MLWFWVIVLVVLIGAVAVVASGRGDAMVDVYDDRPDVALPVGRHLTADDLRIVQFNTGVRGYRMDEVDALLVRLQAEFMEREQATRGPGQTDHHDDAAGPTPADHAGRDEADEPLMPTPAEETPAEETPAEETPAEETPAEETPAEETPGRGADQTRVDAPRQSVPDAAARE